MELIQSRDNYLHEALPSKERVGERSSEYLNDPLKVPVAQRSSERPLPLATTPLGTRRDEQASRRVSNFLDKESGRRHQRSRAEKVARPKRHFGLAIIKLLATRS